MRACSATTRLWDAVLHTAIITVVALPIELVARPAARLPLSRRPAPEAALRRAAHHPLGDLADGRRLDVAADVRRPLRPDQPDHRVDRRRAHLDPLDDQHRAGPIRRSSSATCGSGRRSCSSSCSRRSSNVDQEQLDAAAIDGASRWQAFRNVTLPAIRPVMMIALLIRGLDLIRIFDIVWQLTRGGPGKRDRDHLDLRLYPRLPGVRHELCRRHGRRADHRASRRVLIVAL